MSSFSAALPLPLAAIPDPSFDRLEDSGGDPSHREVSTGRRE